MEINLINNIMKIFTTREIATMIWVAILMIYCTITKDKRKSIIEPIKASIKILITIPGMIMIMYSVGVGYFLLKIGYLQPIMIKDYIVWALFGLIPIVFNVAEKYKTINIIDILKDTLKFSIIPLFIISSYTMNIVAEFFIIPVIVICGGCIAICDYNEKYAKTKKVFNSIVTVISMVMIYYGFKGFLVNLQDIKDIVFWKSILIDIVCSISVVPLILYIRWYVLYEKIGILIEIRSKLNRNLIYLIIFKNCLLNREKLLYLLNNINNFFQIKNWRDLDNRIKEVLVERYKVA